MNQWIDSEDFRWRLGNIPFPTACRYIANQRIAKGVFKGASLIVRTDNTKRGKPSYLILWNTETNQPATQADPTELEPTSSKHSPVGADTSNSGHFFNPKTGETDANTEPQTPRPTATKAQPLPKRAGQTQHHETRQKNASERNVPHQTAAQNGVNANDQTNPPATCQPDRAVMVTSGTPVPATTAPASAAQANPLRLVMAKTSPHQAAQTPSLLLETQADTLLSGKNVAIDTVELAGLTVDPETGDILNAQPDAPGDNDFETLLHRKLQGKPKDKQRSLRWYYRNQYTQTGIIPAALQDHHSSGDGRKTAGRKSTLDPAIVHRFIVLVKRSSEKNDIQNYYTAAHCKVSIFHRELEYEFKQTIPINYLYRLVKKHGLSHYFERMDDNDHKNAKAPSYITSEPVGHSLLLDGVGADYLTVNGANGKPIYPWWINFMDYGSRRIMAIHAYTSESNEASVDILNRYLIENRHAHQTVKLRPDNAKGFLNLKRCITEINIRKKARPDGYTLIDDFSRVGTPVDKAALESSHRALHTFERYIINRFKDRIAYQHIKSKKFGNEFRNITVTHLNISLDELNASGIIQDYQRQHNHQPHRPVVNGKQTSWLLDAQGEPERDSDGKKIKWIPETLWQRHLAAQDTFTFDETDLEAMRIYGYSKHKGTITKHGYISHNSEKYHVADRSLYSTRASTTIQYSVLGNGKLALFNAQQDGAYLGEAIALQATEKPQKIIELEQKKIQKAGETAQYSNLISHFAALDMLYNEDDIKQLMAQGLTEDMTKTALANPKIYLQENKIKQYHYFKAEAKYLIDTSTTQKTSNGISRNF